MREIESQSTVGPLSEAKRKLRDAYLRGSAKGGSAASPPITRRAMGTPAPLSLAQEQVWRRSLRAADSPPLYNETITVYREGPLDVSVLEQCFGEILRRHEAWRTTFDTLNGAPVQVVHPARCAPQIQLVDLRELSAECRQAEAVHLVSEQAQQPFDLHLGPLLRTLLLRLDDTSYRFTIIAHQSIVDGVSAYQLLPTELAALYEAFAAGEPSPLPDLPIQYADYCEWQRDWLQGENYERQKAYWRKQLSGPLPVLAWPKGGQRPVQETYRGVTRPFALPRQLSDAIYDLAHHEGVTLFMTLLAGMTALLHAYTEQPDIVVGTLSSSGRKRSETQRLLGYFLNPVALRFDLSGEPTFRELLVQVRCVISEAISHDDVPLEHLAEELRLDTGPDPLVKLAISLQPRVPHLGPEWNVTSMDAQNGGTAWDLYLAFIEGEPGLIGRAQYNPDLFEEGTIIATLEDLWRVLQAAAADPAKRVKDLLQRSI